jgi:spore coat polysaccharide biosynthesis predicted glycosyltransferase SpsG
VVLLVADAGEAVGLGHLSRLGAIADGLRELGLEPDCLGHGAQLPVEHAGSRWEPADRAKVVAEAAGREIVVVDSYLLGGDALARIAAGSRLAATHDGGDPPAAAELLIAPALPARPHRAGGPRWLAGMRYAALAHGYWRLEPAGPAERVERILVTTGGGDPGGFASRLAAAAARAIPDARTTLVAGPQADSESPPGVERAGPFPSLLDPLREADLVVCAGGHTMLEACAAGTPRLVAVLADNQEPGVAELERLGAVSRIDPTRPDEVAAAVRALGADREARAQMARAGTSAVDGRGALRVAESIARLRS